MNASNQTLIRNPQIEWSGELLSASFRPFRVSSHLPCLFELAKSLICIFLTGHTFLTVHSVMPNRLYYLNKGEGKGEKMLKVGRKRKRKERRKDKKHTNSIARIRARASRPAVSRADKCWAVKRALRSSFNVWCGVGLAWALFLRFRCAWRPAKFSFLQTGNPIFFP